MHNEAILSRFIRDTAQHKCYIEHDDGVYRHVVIKRPGTNTYRYDLTSWPGYLCVTGDMGTWTFSRERDMFTEFFPNDIAVGINPGYWSEKLENGTGGCRNQVCFEFDEDALKKSLNEYLDCWKEDRDLEDETNARTLEELEETISGLLNEHYQDGRAAVDAVYAADWPFGISGYDIIEHCRELERFNFHYQWICYAIVSGLGKYQSKKLTDKAMATFLACNGIV